MSRYKRTRTRRPITKKAMLLGLMALSFTALLVWQTLKPSTGAPADFATYAYQWATDDGTPAARVAVDDTPITIKSGGTGAKDPIVRLRWVMGDSSGAGLSSASLKLQYTTDPTWATGVTDVGAQGATGVKFRYRNSTSVTDGAAATAPITDSDGAAAGTVFESAAASSYTHPAQRKFYEQDFSLEYIGSENTTYYFRVVINGTAIPFSSRHGSQGPVIHTEASGTPSNSSWANHGWKWFADAGACPTTELYTGRDPSTTTVTRDGTGSATPNLRLRWQLGNGSTLSGASLDVVYSTDINFAWYSYVSDPGTTGGKWRYRNGAGTHGSTETCGAAKVSGHTYQAGVWVEQLLTGLSLTGGASKYYEHDISLQYTGNETTTYYFSYVINGAIADMSGMHSSEGAIINTAAAPSPVTQAWRWATDDATPGDRSGADNTYITVQNSGTGSLTPQVRLRHVIRDTAGVGWTNKPIRYQYTTDDTWATGVTQVGAPGATGVKWRFRNSSSVTHGAAASTPITTTNSPAAGVVFEQTSDTYTLASGFSSKENDLSLEYTGDETADYYFRAVVDGSPVTFDASSGNQGPRIKTIPIPTDTTAPTTTLTTSPSAPDGDNGWFVTAPTITLASSESGSTGYRWDAAPTNSVYSVPFLYAAGQGTHTLYYQSTDDVSNVETPLSQQFKLDSVAPANPVLTSPSHITSQYSSDNTVQVDFGASSDASSGIVGFSYAFDTSATTTPDTVVDAGVTSATSGALADGTSHYFHLRSKDAAGNWSTTAHLGPFYVDTVAPSASSNSPLNGATGVGVGTLVTVTFAENVSEDTLTSSTFTLKSSTDDTVAGVISYDSPTRTVTLNPNTSLLYSETYTANVTTGVKDAAGNALSPAHSFSFTTGVAPDTTPPTTTLTKTPSSPDGDNSWYLAAPILSISADEATTDTQYQWDQTTDAWSSGSSPTPGEGNHTLYYRSIDTSGNTEDAKSAVIKLDTVDPIDPDTITSSHAVGTRSSDTTIYMDWSGASDGSSGVDGYSYSFTPGATDVPDDTKDSEETESEATSDSLSDGAYYFHVRTHDNAGNWTSTAHYGPVTIDTADPVTTLETSPASPDGDNSWYLTAPTITLTSSQAGSTGYRWDSAPTNTVYGSPFPYDVGQGIHTLYYQSTDDAANVETPLSQQFKFDSAAPTNPGLTSPSHATSQYSSDNTVQVDFGTSSDATSGVAGFSYLFDTSAATTPDTAVDAGVTSATSGVLADGTSHYFHLRTKDAAGNWSTTTHMGPFYVDTEAPSVSTSSPIDGATGVGVGTNASVTFTEDVSEDTLTGSTFTLKSSTDDTVSAVLSYDAPTKTATLNPNGDLIHNETYTGTVTTGVKDAAGNALSPAFSFSFTTTAGSDTTDPVTTLTKDPVSADGDNGWYVAAPTLTLSANEATADSQFQWDATVDANWSSGSSPAASDGEHVLYFRSIDTSGNTEDANSATIKLDTTDPVDPTAITSPHAEESTSSDATIDMSWSGASDASSGVDGFSHSFTGGATDVPDTTLDDQQDASTTTSASLANGTWYFHIRTRDNAGNWSGAEHYGPVTIDTVAPITFLSTEPVSADGDNGWFVTEPLITLSRDESGTTKYSWDSLPTDSYWLGTWLYDGGQGSHTLYYHSTDDVGNAETPEQSQLFKVDTVSPDAITLGAGSHVIGVSSTDDTVEINWSAPADEASGVDGYAFEFMGHSDMDIDLTKDSEENETGATSDVLEDGEWFFHIHTRDNAGNWSEGGHFGPFIVDTVPPIAGITTSPLSPDGNGSWFTSTPDITLSMDEAGYLEYQWDATEDAQWQSYSVPFEAEQGEHVLFYRAIDDANQTSDIESQVFSVDTALPLVSISSPANGSTVNGPGTTVDGTASEAGASGLDKTQVQINGGAWTDAAGTSTWTYGWTHTSDAAYAINARSLDLAGNTSSPASVTVTVDNTPPAVTSTSPADSATDIAVASNVAVTFSETVSPDTMTGANFSMVDSTDDAVAGVVSWDNGTKTATLNPSSNLAYGTEYTATVSTGVKDSVGNPLASPFEFSFTTVSEFDVSPPGAPAGVWSHVFSTTQGKLYWNPATDDVGVTGYEVYDDVGSLVGSTASPYYDLPVLTPGNTYEFRIKALDEAGNRSAYSNTVTVTAAYLDTTPAGSGTYATTVAPSDGYSVTFADVTADGVTSMDQMPSPPSPPSRYSFLGAAVDVTTTAGIDGDIVVGISFAGGGVVDETDLRMFHYENGEWVNVTTHVDTEENIVFGTASSLSPFVIGNPSSGGGWWKESTADPLGSADWQSQVGNTDFGSPHGGFSTTSNLCKTCHAVHNSMGGSYRLLKNVSRTEECNYCHMGVSGLSKYRLYAFEDLGMSIKGEHSLGSTDVPDSNLVGQANRAVSADAQVGELFSRGGPYDDNGKQQLDCYSCHSVHGANTITDSAAGGWTRRILRANPGASPGGFDANNGLTGANAAALGFSGLVQTDSASLDSRLLTPVKNLSTIRGVYCGSCHNRNFNFRENETNGRDFSLQRSSHPMGTDSTLDVGGGAGISAVAQVSWQNVAWCGSCHAAPVELGGVTSDAGPGYAGQLGEDQNANAPDVEDWGTRWYAAGFPHQSESNKLLFQSYTAGGRDATQTNDALEGLDEMDAVCGKCHTASQDFTGDDGVGLTF